MQSNFTEIKGLIEFVNTVLVKRINELEDKVSVLTKVAEIGGTVRVSKQMPLFDLDIDGGDDDASDKSEDEYGLY